MSPPISFDATAQDGRRQVLWQDGERALYRGAVRDGKSTRQSVLTLRLTREPPAQASLDRLAHEYELRDRVDGAWAARPLELVRDRDWTMLVLDDPGGEPLDWHLGEPMEISRFLHLAIGIAAALGQVHARDLIHRDLKPTHILVDGPGGQVHLTGFGLASRLPRERQSPRPPEYIVGTLAYMAPEQTGRMNRSIDSRSDLYSMGVIFYQMLTGLLPFAASDPMEWVHCHIARTPVPPQQRAANIPGPISRIVTKLLAKTAEERYQTAAGVERDLRRCLAEWQTNGRIESFLPGESDSTDRLMIPERLLGREREIAELLGAYDRVLTSGTSELMLISGHSGTGKSSIVNELHKALVPSHGLFASGKFDQHTHDIPYKAIAQALQGLILGLMSTSDTELKIWRNTLREALGVHGQLVAALVPEIKLVIGEQPAPPDLPPQQTRRLFETALRHFIGAFARPQQPLALFLDDLHGADVATLDLLADLMTQSDMRHLLVIGAYRDNEIERTQPLKVRIENIRSAGVKVGEIALRPLGRAHIEEFVASALRCKPAQAAPLGELVHQKTDGNPFFVIKFLSTLADRGLIAFSQNTGEWSWDLARIRAQEHTDNVIELLLDKLNQQSAEAKAALQQLACLGNVATTAMLATVLECSEERVHTALGTAVRQDLVECMGDAYRFVHDRVQESAYASIPAGDRAAAHLRIGRLLVARTPPEQQDEAIFEILNQLNRGLALITSTADREELAEFNLMAGRRSAASTAFDAALKYFATGRELLAEDCWERHPRLIFELELHRAECEMLTGALSQADKHLAALRKRAKDTADQANVARLRIDLYSMLHQMSDAVASGLDYMRSIGVHWRPHPSDEQAHHAYLRLREELDRRTSEELVALPLMTDVASLAALDVMNRLCSPAQYTELNLYTVVVCQMLQLTLERGNGDASAAAYVRLGMVAGLRLGQYEFAERVGRIAFGLVEQRGLRRYQAAVYLNYGNLIMPWTRPMRACWELAGQAFDTAQKTGDFMYAGVSAAGKIGNLLAASDSLADVQHEAETMLAFAQKLHFIPGVQSHSVTLALVRTLRGTATRFGHLEDELFGEQRLEHEFANPSENPGGQGWYWTCKLQARFMAGDYAAALHAGGRARPLLGTPGGIMQVADYHFFSALSYTVSCNSGFAEGGGADAALASHHRQLADWAAICPQNFEDRALLVGAEIARLAGRELDAEQLFARAVRVAQANGSIRNEALANELASRFYRGRHLEDIAEMHLLKARSAYLRWGAAGKARQLEALHPQLASDAPPVPTGSIGVPVDHLDLATVVKLSQTVASEIVLERLIDTLVRTAVEQAGAQRGVLLVPREDGLWCAAEGNTVHDGIAVERRDCPLAETSLPQSVILYVQRTREALILDDATAQHPFAADPYVCQRQAKSILCLPLLAQAKLSGVLYLENNVAPRVFVHARTAVLKLLASQAAIALENARLYAELQKAHRFEAMGTLAGGIAHDFNNILGAVLGYGEMALRDAPAGTRLRRDLEAIMVAGERGRALVERVLAFSRSGVVERVAVHIEGVVREALDLLGPKMPEGILLEAQLDAGPAAILGEPTQVHQVLMNLATNAIQAMPAGGTLAVLLEIFHSECARPATVGNLDVGEYIRLTVTDSGVGISHEIIDKIFDPFFTTKEAGVGTGLGLSLVHGIVMDLGGAMDVSSRRGAGSTFTVFLPRSGDAFETVENHVPTLPGGDGEYVLVVDDEEPLVKLAARTLEELGYVPVSFTSGIAALAAFRDDPARFDAMITDERMPRISGLALVREVRALRHRMPILLMSGYVGGGLMERAREAGADDVLKKPLSAHDLATGLARVLQK